MMARKSTGGDTDTELREAFNVFDRDGTGTISREELRAVMVSLGESLTEKDIDEMLKEADTDGDGQIDCEYLSYFITALLGSSYSILEANKGLLASQRIQSNHVPQVKHIQEFDAGCLLPI